MILAHPTFENMISFDENAVEILVVEDRCLFSRYISELSMQVSGGIGDFSLYDDNERLNIAAIDLIVDPFSLSPNSRSVLNAVFKGFQDLLLSEYHYMETNRILQSIDEYMSACVSELDPYLVLSDDINCSKLIKLVDPRFILNEESLLERISDYIRAIKLYTDIRLLIFVNLKTFLSVEDLNLLYDFTFMNKIPILLLENTVDKSSPCERLHIIDGDLCEISDI